MFLIAKVLVVKIFDLKTNWYHELSELKLNYRTVFLNRCAVISFQVCRQFIFHYTFNDIKIGKYSQTCVHPSCCEIFLVFSV